MALTRARHALGLGPAARIQRFFVGPLRLLADPADKTRFEDDYHFLRATCVAWHP
jgi:hypothetical protein